MQLSPQYPSSHVSADSNSTLKWIRPGHPALVVAPMEGVTDAPMRALLTERGGFAFCVSEFLRVSQTVPPLHVFFRHIPELRTGALTASGVPVQVQLLGGDPERLAESALVAVQAGAKAIDLNFGCPAPTVNRHDGGATLLKYPDRIYSIVSALRSALPREIPVSAKLRLGWEDPSAIHLNAEMAVKGGAAWITIHGRTRSQAYQPPAYWEPIGQVQKSLGNVPVVANGDIWTLDDFKRCRDLTRCEHFMLGRGALANPALPLQVAAELGLKPEKPDSFGANPESWTSILQRFHEISLQDADTAPFILKRMKQWVRYAGNQNPIPWVESFKRAQSMDEAFKTMWG